MEEKRSSFLFFFFFFFFFSVLCLVVLLSSPLAASSSINHGNYGGGGSNYTILDRIALLSFKSFIISNDPHGALETWNINGDLCTSWQGITCGRKHRRVMSLDLGSLNLTGTISPSVANITFLHRLDLSDNSLGGSIPGELGTLSRLQHLNLSRNSLEGSIPASLSHCSRLRTISLEHNQLSGRIPSTLGALSPLSILSLSHNRLEAKDSGDWDFLAALSNCSKLQKLSLSDNQLGGSLPSSAEYGIGNQVSKQGDLYSYGIVILEMFTGRGPTDDGFKEGLNLRRFVEMAFSEQLMEIIDPYLLTDVDVDILPQDMGIRNKNLECITEVLQIGLSCSNESPMDRMHIEDVIKNMEDIRDAYNRNGAQG